MRAFVITGPGSADVREVAEPVPEPGQVIVSVRRAGICGTDMEIFSGEMSYLHSGQARYPMRIGHEWAGVVAAVGPGVDPDWMGRRVTGDTMLGCGHCERCRGGRQHVCADRYEIGIRGGWPGALAERLPVPVTALKHLPDSVDDAQGALVEPGANALRAVGAAGLTAGERLLILGPGTIGLLAAQIATAQGLDVHLLGRGDDDLEFARSLGLRHAWTAETLPALRWDGVLDASNAAASPARSIELVEPGRRVVWIGLAAEPSPVDSRQLVFKDVTAVGVLSGSGGLDATIELYSSGAVDPRGVVAATVGLADLAAVLGGARDAEWGRAPKIHVDPLR